MPGSDDEKDEQKTTPWGAEDRTTPNGSTPPQISSVSPAGNLDSEKPRADSHGNEVIAGQVFGHYRILEKVGEGGMGVVYRARDERLERDVALKVLPAKALADETARALLLREARTASSLNHPHICTIYDVGEVNGQMYVSMELLKGRPLSAMIIKGGLPVETVVRYGAQIAEALHHAHAHGIIHRDLKSANVVVTNEERAKVLDFGIAKRFRAQELAEATQSTDSLEMSGPITGTLPYMSPEVLRGTPADVRSDVWGLGVVLYEMAAGVLPFRGQTGSDLTSSILRDQPAPLPTRVPSGLRAVIQHCLEKEPERRCRSANEVHAVLAAMQTEVRGGRISGLGSRRGVPIVSAAVAVVLLAALFGLNVLGLRDRILRSSAPPPPVLSKIQSIAVLPLDNLSHEPTQEYLAEGMTDELTTALMGLRRLKVVSRTSAMAYKGTRDTLPSIARQLGADAVVEGAVLQDQNRVRISARLLYAPTERELWAATYFCDLKNISRLQNQLAKEIASEVGASLSPEEQARLANSPQGEPAAYDDYLRRRYRNVEDVAAARKNVEELRKLGIERAEAVSEIDRAAELNDRAALLAKEDDFWKKGVKAYTDNEAGDARKAFDEISKLQGGQRRADAQDYLAKRIPKLEMAGALLSQARPLAQKKDKPSLEQARGLVKQVIAMNGPLTTDARNLEGTINRNLDALSGAAAATERRINDLKSGAAQDISHEDFAAARAKADEIKSRGGDASQVMTAIDRAEQGKVNSFQAQFNSAKNDGNALKQLQGELQKYGSAPGRIGDTAKDLLARIPTELERLAAASRPVPAPSTPAPSAPAAPAAARGANVQILGLPPVKWTGPLVPGQLVGSRYLDIPLRLLGGAVPPEIVQRAATGSSMQLRLAVNDQGRVTGGEVQMGDIAIGQSLVNVAKASWQFSTPRVNGKQVTTAVTLKVQF